MTKLIKFAQLTIKMII